MAHKKIMDAKIGVTLVFFVAAFVLLVVTISRECEQLAIREAEKNLTGFLLSQRAVREFIEDVQKQEVYRLKKEGLLYREYFSPKLLSSTYIARNIIERQNHELEKTGLAQVYFKFASRNPRNPLNRADSAELALLDDFNAGRLQEYQAVIDRKDEKALYYAIPVGPNKDSCMRCHGDPAAAPQELLDSYGDKAGFHERLGEIRALMSVRVPMQGLLAEARQTVALLSAVAFFLLAGSFGLVMLFFRKIETQTTIAMEKSYYLNSVLQSSTETAIIATDRDGNIRYVNQAAEQLFAIPTEERTGNIFSLCKSVDDDQQQHLHHAVAAARQDGKARLTLHIAERVLEIQLSTIRNSRDNYAGLLLLGQDISGQLRDQEEKERIKARLQKAEKMESIGLMAGGVAHDLNNILSGIISYPELLLRKMPAESELRGYVDGIKQSGIRAAAVVADLLTVARGVASKKEVCDLNALVREYLESPDYLKLMEQSPDVACRNELVGEDLPLYCSPVHIRKCIMNLMINAVEALSEKGQCTLQTGRQVFDDRRAQSFNVQPGEYCFIRLSDTGPGIAENHINKIFEPFYSTKKLGRSGTGLGLSVVWNTVKEHGGVVLVESGADGTTFELYFPLCGEPRDVTESSGPQEEMRGCGETVLVVDDENQLRDIAQTMLKELNYRVIAVSSGEQAIFHLQQQPVDLVLLDMLMEPGINGRQAFEEIIRLRPGQKAVIASGYSESEDVKQTLEHGACGFISKPYSMDELARAVHTALKS